VELAAVDNGIDVNIVDNGGIANKFQDIKFSLYLKKYITC